MSPEPPACGKPRGVGRREAFVAFACVLAAAASIGAAQPRGAVASPSCQPPPPTASARQATLAALISTRDLFGERLEDAPGGPSAAAAAALLPPLFYARAAHRTPLTSSGAYYLAFGEPVGALGAGAVALHLADGSEIISQRVGGASLTIGVGSDGQERYGSCLTRLATPALAGGYLPILETRYRDAEGASYTEESFSATVSGIRGLVSFVSLQGDTQGAHAPVSARFSLALSHLRALPGRLLSGPNTVLLESPGGRLEGSSLRYPLAAKRTSTILVAFLERPGRVGAVPPLAELYARAREALGVYWRRKLAQGASVTVPDGTVDDAERALLIENLELGYRYSVGNTYQEFSYPETIDVARVMGEWGFAASDRAILMLSLTRPPTSYPNWTRGEKLVGVAEAYALDGDRSFVEAVTPTLAGYVGTMARELSPRSDLLPPEHYSSDIPLDVQGLPGQSVAWEGLVAIARTWTQTGHAALAARARRLAAALHAGLERALARSERWLSDGSLFVPAVLDGGEQPYASLTHTRLGSYWNLVMPYALASGLFPPGSRQARGILSYLRLHGALLAGLVRAGAYSLYGRHAPPPTSGTDEVYGVNLSRFLAANGQAGELDLSLYGELGDAMTPGTYVSGEAASVAPIPGEVDRAMYLPPNSAANATFLETLRLALLSESDSPGDTPHGLELAPATPRRWLEPGRTIEVHDLPTSFGPVSFTIRAHAESIAATIRTPPRTPPSLLLRLRLPGDERIGAVVLDGRRYARFDAATSTIALGGMRGTLDLAVSLRGSDPTARTPASAPALTAHRHGVLG